MNADRRPQSAAPGPTSGQRSRLGLVLGVLALGFVIVLGLRWRAAQPGGSPTDAEKSAAAAESAENGSGAANPAGALSQVFRRNGGSAVDADAAPGAAAPPIDATPVRSPARPPLTAEGREALRLLNGLAAAGRNGSPAEQAARWQETMDRVVALGPAGIPGIREFLDARVDLLPPDGLTGTNIFPGSLRAQMIDTLVRLGGTEAMDALVGALPTSTAPDELAHIARNLELMAPGRFRAEIVRAAADSLNQAASAATPGAQVAPIFQLMQTHGDASIIPDLVNQQKKWPFYATIALGGLPDGQGVPELIRMAGDTSSASGASTRMAMEALAQAAPGNPAAAAALLELAQASKINPTAWATLASRLAGVELALGEPPAGYVNQQLTTWHINSGNQNYYAAPNRSGWQNDDYERRRQLIDRFLALSPGGDPQRHLQAARDSLVPAPAP